MKKNLFIALLLLSAEMVLGQDILLTTLMEEAGRSLSALEEQPVPAYYISYRVYETESYDIHASFGNLVNSSTGKSRSYYTVVRVGNHETDNSGGGSYSNFGGRGGLPLDDDPLALQMTLWEQTDQSYKNAIKQYESVKANSAVRVAAEDRSNDFSAETPEKYTEKPLRFKDLCPNIKTWEDKIRKISATFAGQKEIVGADASFRVELTRKYFADSDGAGIVENSFGYRVNVTLATVAEDGMVLPLYRSYFAHDIKDLPSDTQILAEAEEMGRLLSALREAPIAEPYSGPALMTAKASGVFFHEIFGHRVEGARLKQESDAQTFKKMIGKQVLPDVFSIFFDPLIKKYKGMPLSGYYRYDDEGVGGQKVKIVEDGLLRSFLMSRTPIEGFPNSNGHGRGAIQALPVTRQSNMIIESKDSRTEKELREMLIEEARKQNKQYAYLFDDVSGGFTTTGRFSPNAFNVTPLVVYRVYVDGRPDELVRGVDLVGTPLAIFSQIAACGNEYEVFNGYCGAESGSVPVSCVAPTLFVKMVETQRKAKSQSQPPVLERP